MLEREVFGNARGARSKRLSNIGRAVFGNVRGAFLVRAPCSLRVPQHRGIAISLIASYQTSKQEFSSPRQVAETS